MRWKDVSERIRYRFEPYVLSCGSACNVAARHKCLSNGMALTSFAQLKVLDVCDSGH